MCKGETIGYTVDIDKELPSEVQSLALSVVEPDDGQLESELEPLEMADSGVKCRILLLSPQTGTGAGEDVELCSDEDVLESLAEPYDADGNILAVSIAPGLKG